MITQHKLEILRNKEDFLEEILSEKNVLQALKHVCQNKGAPGIDGKTTQDLRQEFQKEWPFVRESILKGTYKPKQIRRVSIPKSNGGERILGIPSVMDRLIQQAITQRLVAYIDESFEESSYGYRPQRSAQQAAQKAKECMENGFEISINIDIEAFFDRVNQDRLMSQLKGLMKDQRVLDLIRKFLNSGILSTGIPQGSPLSPLLSNIYLDVLDKEMAKRGHCYVRYADDCKIFTRTVRSGERIMESVKHFIQKKLKLRVNESKSHVGKKSNFLGFVISKRYLSISPATIKKFKNRVRDLTPIRGGRSIESVINDLAPVIRGWGNYFKIAACKSTFRSLDSWIRRRIRALLYKGFKTGRRRYEVFQKGRFNEHVTYTCAYANAGAWAMSMCKPMRIMFSKDKLKNIGLVGLEELR
jgi:RNA-directed DNA polymerase